MALATKKSGGKKDTELVTRNYTIHMHKLMHNIQFKMCVPRALRKIRKFAMQAMITADIRIDTKLIKFIWGNGICSMD